MAMIAPTEPVDFDAVPGVDVVTGESTRDLESLLLTDRVLTVAGTVHRRFLDRRSALLRERLIPMASTEASAAWTGSADQHLELLRGPDLCAADGASWAGRLQAYRTLAAISDEPGMPVARIRGWDQTDAAVLVDGRAISASILDATVVLEHQARRFEAGEQPFVLCLPDLRSVAEARVWASMLGRVQDRLGIPRGAVPIILSLETHEAVAAAPGIMAQFRDSCVGLCIAEGQDLDEVSAKEAAEQHEIRWIGAIPSSLDPR